MVYSGMVYSGSTARRAPNLGFAGEQFPEEAEIIRDIKKRKELAGLPDDFVRQQLIKCLRRSPALAGYLSRSRSGKYRQLIKLVRAELRKVHGLYQVAGELEQRRSLLGQLLAPDMDSAGVQLSPRAKSPKEQLLIGQIIRQILGTHASTRERLEYYPRLYRKIFALTGKPQGIIDLGCGINPYSLVFILRSILKSPGQSPGSMAGSDSESQVPPALEYHAFDISETEVQLLKDFFQFLRQKYPHFRGSAEVLDVSNWAKLAELPEADVCFLFKMSDVLDRGRGHKATEMVLKSVPAKFVVLSFPATTMSGRRMRFPQRRWLELLCRRLEYGLEYVRFEKEVFAVVGKAGGGKVGEAGEGKPGTEKGP